MAGIFKAYDVRGVYPDELNPEIARKIGRVFRAVLDPKELERTRTVIVSRDMRDHSVPLRDALVEGLLESGLDVVDIGLATTPMNYFAVGSMKAAGGIQVTASHNPAKYNGLKFSRHGARPVKGDEGIALMERLVAAEDWPESDRAGELSTSTIDAAYGEHVLAHLHRRADGKKLKVVADAANGMGTVYQGHLENTGIELVPLYFELDGTFPNHEANPLKQENLDILCDKVRETGADLGVSFDGDADRAAFVDERGEAVGSDLSTALIAGALLGREDNAGSAIVYDLRSSRAVAEYIEEQGGRPILERVGHSFIKATMRKENAVFGGELAGHYYFRDNYTADCALLAVVEILNLLNQTGKPLSELVRPLMRYAKAPETNFEVEDKAGKIEELAERYADGRQSRLDGITVEYDDWWFNVRPSNTEPFLRLVLEAKDEALLEEKMNEVGGMIGVSV